MPTRDRAPPDERVLAASLVHGRSGPKAGVVGGPSAHGLGTATASDGVYADVGPRPPRKTVWQDVARLSVHVYVHTHIRIYIYMYACMYVCICNIYIYIYIYALTHFYIYIYRCMYE